MNEKVETVPEPGLPKRGRPARSFTPAEVKQAKKVWRDTETYPHWRDAVAAFPPGFTRDRAYKQWRGRK